MTSVFPTPSGPSRACASRRCYAAVESISEEWLRGALYEDEVSHQSIRTWKTSPDPLFEAKKRKLDPLTRKRPDSPVVLSADEIGPIQLIPHGGEDCSLTSVPGESLPSTTGSSGRPTTSLH